MSEVTFDISGLEDSPDNRCKAFEVRFTIPVNADWLRGVIQKALTVVLCQKCKERAAASPPDVGGGLCFECMGKTFDSNYGAEDG